MLNAYIDKHAHSIGVRYVNIIHYFKYFVHVISNWLVLLIFDVIVHDVRIWGK